MPSILDQPIYNNVREYYGDPDTPQSIKRFRKNDLQTMRRVGTPIILKRMYTDEDVQNGVAQQAQTLDTTYGSSLYAQDYISYGVGFSSIETQDGEWVNTQTGELEISPYMPDDDMGTVFTPAPRYRGYGPGFLTYGILPDRPEDAWKLTEQGALIRTQAAMVQLPWWPQVGDNDLLITVRLDRTGNVVESYERYELKMVTPITIRGQDRRGNREFPVNAGGNRFWINQQAEMIKIPTNDIRYQVEIDR